MLLTIHNINMFSYTFSSSLQFTLLTFLHISSGICDLSKSYYGGIRMKYTPIQKKEKEKRNVQWLRLGFQIS